MDSKPQPPSPPKECSEYAALYKLYLKEYRLYAKALGFSRSCPQKRTVADKVLKEKDVVTREQEYHRSKKTCKKCKEQFKSRNAMFRHIRSVHEGFAGNKVGNAGSRGTVIYHNPRAERSIPTNSIFQVHRAPIVNKDGLCRDLSGFMVNYMSVHQPAPNSKASSTLQKESERRLEYLSNPNPQPKKSVQPATGSSSVLPIVDTRTGLYNRAPLGHDSQLSSTHSTQPTSPITHTHSPEQTTPDSEPTRYTIFNRFTFPPIPQDPNAEDFNGGIDLSNFILSDSLPEDALDYAHILGNTPPPHNSNGIDTPINFTHQALHANDLSYLNDKLGQAMVDSNELSEDEGFTTTSAPSGLDLFDSSDEEIYN